MVFTDCRRDQNFYPSSSLLPCILFLPSPYAFFPHIEGLDYIEEARNWDESDRDVITTRGGSPPELSNRHSPLARYGRYRYLSIIVGNVP